MDNKFGPGLEMMLNRLRMLGEVEGINFTFTGRYGNTRDSHRLIQLGKKKGNEILNRVVAELFKSYFEGDGDITSHATLIAAAEKAGMETGEVKDWLETGDGGAEADKEVQEALANDIPGCPHYTFQDTKTLYDPQKAEKFVAMFAEIKGAN